ncbi:molybdenum ABC transporter ATP-binding protein [Falsochrobactrum shanghaiense]|uniref:Molybdenum ABC transporter ATP-binding protein n=1 Tax=Falsochrobactrum shanghaiense TaxID=2201899 RepID=A0A316J6N0_9HYPH|nr:molybdenum ABC transporter ATP-binding protein [Falsochrobactrum shanghaiense]PWL17354.1 molybdenum ABC transporter ATP-binding protein [Falsochrobactrum shanghaiense]
MSRLEVSIAGRNGKFAVEADFAADWGVTALFGHSGAGKTTLLKMIAGTLRPESGRIAVGDFTFFDAQKSINLPPEKRRIGYVFQEARLFPHMNVKSNLTYARWAGRREARRNFSEVLDLLGIKHLLERRPSTLSGGERQRVAIGRALLSDPALLLLDEPLSSLDHARRQEILPFIERLRDESHVPIVYVSHETDEVARLADEIVLLSGGKVQASGPAAEIFPIIDADGERGGVLLEGMVCAYDSAYQLAEIDLDGAIFQLGDMGLRKNMHVRLRVRARDVSIARAVPDTISIRNILPVTIKAIEADGGPNALVALDFKGRRLGARLTRRSVDELGLREGEKVFALVKAVSVDRAAIREG